MEVKITDEIHYLIKRIDETDGEPMNIHEVLVPSVSNIIMQLVFGHRYEYNEPTRQNLDQTLDQMPHVFNRFGFLATAPVWLARIAFKMGLYGDHKKFDYSYQLFDKEISSHQKSLDLNTKRDYIDGYLMEMDVRQRKDPNSNFNMKRLQANCRTFFGGSVTIRTITEWMLLFAVRYTEHQKRIHEEIDSVVGRDRSPCYADRLHMPFTQAFINEGLVQVLSRGLIILVSVAKHQLHNNVGYARHQYFVYIHGFAIGLVNTFDKIVDLIGDLHLHNGLPEA
ncbi:unnamed protein product [Oppiella nova]|uniref:Cytochrome P450 n=1 Tax=Oppiella nova TaxID=334625 RepID=A0A7R9LU63_9ACAR|nr:unnamed protein product [Oppiella nova]CAG2166248.1 unnamed protein product [Oppiella nova]